MPGVESKVITDDENGQSFVVPRATSDCGCGGEAPGVDTAVSAGGWDKTFISGPRPTGEQIKEMNSRIPFIGMHFHLDGATADEAMTAMMRSYPEITDVQIFTHGPQSSRPTKAYLRFFETAARNKVRIWTHGSYLCVPWSQKSPYLVEHTIDNIRASAALGSGCTVAHIPFAPCDVVVAGIAKVVSEMRRLNIRDTKLMLETSATVQDAEKSYESPEKLNKLTTAIKAAGFQDCVRICVDTAHIFAGKAVVGSYDDASAWWSKLDTSLIGMIHLNGSSYDPDKIKGDKHEVPLSVEDLIWGGRPYKVAGCRAFVENARRLRIPIILELGSRHSPEAIRRFIDATK